MCPLSSPSCTQSTLTFYAGCSQLVWKGQGEREPASSPAKCKILRKVIAISWQLRSTWWPLRKENIFNIKFNLAVSLTHLTWQNKPRIVTNYATVTAQYRIDSCSSLYFWSSPKNLYLYFLSSCNPFQCRFSRVGHSHSFCKAQLIVNCD